MAMYFMFFGLMYFGGLISFLFYNKHLMCMLISLEMMGLSLFFLVFFNFLLLGQDVYICLLFLIMIVCEGSLGLGILIYVVRVFGSDYYQMLNLIEC